ncbi:hypothetical protein GJJ30_26125 [Larkinella terrae]|uniref:Cytochrome b561 domain-containing protein n=2 Tax=Larkinella terrae TaxID=2025311 RepID=A0A7K0ESL2_9BACT|nr:hypothetical protein [Larkinella terrae]
MSGSGYAQVATSTPDSLTTSATSADSLLNELVDSKETPALLPPHMIFTQRFFWGPRGVLRNLKVAPLTPEGRAHELKIRRTMLVSHQVMGFVTLAGFIAQGIVGAKLYDAKGESFGKLLNTHSTLATCVNITYTTTALLSLAAPPKMVLERSGFSSIKLHKYLAVLHIAGMITTNVLSGMIDSHPELKPYHRAAAYTTFGAFAASIIAIKF